MAGAIDACFTAAAVVFKSIDACGMVWDVILMEAPDYRRAPLD